jgi:hypothetical protein
MNAIHAMVLATEPGDIVRERQLHRRFNHLLGEGREWFHPGSELVAYINRLREASGASPIDWRTQTIVGRTQPVDVRTELTVYLAEATASPIARTLTRNGELLGGYPARAKWARPDRPPRVHAAVTGIGPTKGTAVAACTRSQEVGHGGENLILVSEVPADARCGRPACRTRWATLPD